MSSLKMKKAACALLVLALMSCPVSAHGAAADSASLNSSPVAQNIELTTYRNVPVTGSFTCLDPEGDAVTYRVSRSPKKGSVQVDGDSFTYTPASGKKGKDHFTYVAVDSAGNVSNEASVTIVINKRETGVTYSDMAGSPAQSAAVLLAEEGIFVGEKLGSRYIFRPDEPVTRGEFLVMCVKLSGQELLDGIVRTGFYDDDLIPSWQKPYVTTALTMDIITGSTLGDGHIVFSPDTPITFAEASVMINNTLGITDVYMDGVPDTAPAWACQAAGNLTSCDIISDISQGVSTATLTRADAATLLAAALPLTRPSPSDSLLSWAQ